MAVRVDPHQTRSMNTTPESERPGGTPPGNAFFTWLRDLGIVRGSDRWFAGVAGGIAAKAGIDPLIVRGVFVVLAVLGGPGILLYLAGWLLLPDATGRIHVEDIVRGRAQAGVLTAAIIIAAVVIIPALLSLIIPAVSAPFGVWGWDLWGTIGVPSWLSTTVAWLFWIAILVFGFMWVRKALLRRGREQGAGQETPNGPAAGPGSGSDAGWGYAASSGSGAGTGPGTASGSGSAPSSNLGAGPHTGSTVPPADSFTAQTRSFADRTEEFAQRAGSQAGDWGKRAGDTATRWSEDLGKQADEWSARYAEHHDAHRLGAAQTILTLALALLAGGLTALWALDAQPELPFQSAAPAVVIAAIVAALAVVAVSLIIAGVRGRNTGFVGFLAFCGVIALLVTVVLPWGTRFQPFGTMHIDAGSVPGAVVLAGGSKLDLRDLDTQSDIGSDLVIWQLTGRTDITLPEEVPAIVTVRVLGGRIDEGDTDSRRSGGPFLGRTITANLPAGDTASSVEDAARVTVYLGFGRVDIDGESDVARDRQISDRGSRVGGDGGASDSSDAEKARNERAAAALDEELQQLDWQLDEPGLSTEETAALERERDAVRDELREHEKEMAR